MEVSFEIRPKSEVVKFYKKKLETEPVNVFMNGAQFTFRVGSHSKRHIVLKEIENNMFNLLDGTKVISTIQFNPGKVDNLATHIRFDLFKYFFGENKFKSALDAGLLTKANPKDYPTLNISQKNHLKNNHLKNEDHSIVKESNLLLPINDTKSSAPFTKATASSEIPTLAVPVKQVVTVGPQESTKLNEDRGSKDEKDTKPENVSWGKWFSPNRFPLIFSLGVGFGGGVREDGQSEAGARGVEFAVGAHFKNEWSAKILRRFYKVYDSNQDKVLEQNLNGILVLKKMNRLPLHFTFGIGSEKLNTKTESETYLKPIVGLSLSLYDFFSLELREEFLLGQYGPKVRGITGSPFMPLFLINVGYSL